MSRPSGPGLLSAVARIRGIPAVWGARRTGRQGGIADPRAFRTSKDAAVAVGEAESRDPDALREPRKEPDAVVAPRERHKNQIQNAGITRNETAVDNWVVPSASASERVLQWVALAGFSCVVFPMILLSSCLRLVGFRPPRGRSFSMPARL